jgi:hypothetical protein
MSDRNTTQVDPGLAFPVLAIDKYAFDVRRSMEDLTVVPTPLIKSGWFQRLRILDSAGRTFEVSGVQQLHGVGFLWGWHFYGRRVRVQIEFRKVEPDATLEEIRGDLLKRLKGWKGWQSRDDYDELLSDVKNAESVAGLIAALGRRQR